MKKVFKIFLVIFIVFAIIVVALRIYLNKAMEKSIPDYNSNTKLENLHSDVTVYRDQFAIPHIYATNEDDLYRATGYVMAQDRLWQMDILRRLTMGRIGEVFPGDLLNVDILFRALQISEKSKTIIDSSNTNTVQALEAFTSGVNQFIEQNKDNLPVEFKLLGYQPEPWEPYHSVNLIGYMAWTLKAGWANLFLEELKNRVDEEKRMELLPDVTAQKNYIFIPEVLTENNDAKSLLNIFEDIAQLGIQVFNASNNWAVSGSKTQTGKPLFANDMHLDFNIPGTWYQIHQVIDGQLNVTGLALPGQPLVIAGHNEKIAWGMTNTYVDNLDFYEEKINPENKDQYELNGQWKDLILKDEIFKNKKGKETRKTLRYSHRGPVISDIRSEIESTLSMAWMGSVFSNELEAVYKLNRANDWNEFKDAVKGFVAVSQNINYADTEGNIGLYCCAGIPVRNRNIATGFLPGWTDEYDWKGIVPFEELPFEYNPSKGYVASANNRTIDDSYKHHIGTWYSLPYRFQKITETLEDTKKFSPGDFMMLQTNIKSKLAENYTKRILEILDKNISQLNKFEIQCLEKLKSWDYTYDQNSSMALLFEEIYLQTLTNLLKDEMGGEMFLKYLEGTGMAKYAMENAFNRTVFSWCDDINTKDKQENLEDIILISYKDAIGVLSKKHGGDISKWKWGEWHQLELKHYLGKINILDRFLNINRGPFPLQGSWHTAGPYSFNFSKPFEVVHGASHRHIYDLSNWDQSLTVIPTGNCGVPLSKHYADQTELFVNNKYHEDYFSKEFVVKKAKYIMEISGK